MPCGLLDQVWGEQPLRGWRENAGVAPGSVAQELGELCTASDALPLGLSFLTFITVVPAALRSRNKGGSRRRAMQREAGTPGLRSEREMYSQLEVPTHRFVVRMN